MNKLIITLSFVLALAACKKDEIVPGPGITGNVILVESVSIVTNDGNDRLAFEYDENNRVIKMQSLDAVEDYQEVQYGDNKIIITQHAGHGFQTLISDCKVEGGKRITSNKFTEIYADNNDEIGTLYYEYNPDGTLKKLDARDAGEAIGEYKKITTYTWTNGNLTDCKLAVTANYEGAEMTVMTSTAKITYLDQENNKANLDFNWYLLNNIANENYDYAGILGYMGKSCKNYIASMEMSMTYMGENDTEKTEAEYVFDNDGCPTTMKIYDVYSNGNRELSESYEIGYKK